VCVELFVGGQSAGLTQRTALGRRVSEHADEGECAQRVSKKFAQRFRVKLFRENKELCEMRI
jgi:hypothetical protein